MYTMDFIICHLVEVAKTTHENLIDVGDTITVIAQSLSYGGN